MAAAAGFFFAPHFFDAAATDAPQRSVKDDPLRALKPEDAFAITVQRAYAVDKRFQEVYNGGWEAANGAIGEAFLYAATGNANLLKVYTERRKLTDMFNGTWVDDRAWICLAELYWWQFSGRTNSAWVEDAKKRYVEARSEGRLSNKEGFWSWYSWPPEAHVNDMIITNSNTNQMVTVACMLYDATHDRQFYKDAMAVWEGDRKTQGLKRHSTAATASGKAKVEEPRSASSFRGREPLTCLSWRQCIA